MENASRWDKMRGARRRSSSEGSRREQNVHNRTKRVWCLRFRRATRRPNRSENSLRKVELRGWASKNRDKNVSGGNRARARDVVKHGGKEYRQSRRRKLRSQHRTGSHGLLGWSQDFLPPKHQRTWKTDTRQVNLLGPDQSMAESWYSISKKTANPTLEKDVRFGVWCVGVCGKQPRISRIAYKFDIEPQNPMDPMTEGEPVYLIPVRLQLQPTCICVTSGTAARKVPGLNVLVSEWMAIGDALDGMWPTHAIQQDPETTQPRRRGS